MNSTDPKFSKATAKYCDLMAAGKGSKEALRMTGLSHSQGDRAWYADPRNPNAVKVRPTFPTLPEDTQVREIVEMRAGAHADYPGKKLSWGRISVITTLAEGRIATLFGSGTGVAREGTRIGRGGRWLEGEPRFYKGNRKGIGVEAPKPRELDPEAVAKAADDAKSVIPARLTKLKAGAKARVRKAAAKPATPAPTPEAEKEEVEA